MTQSVRIFPGDLAAGFKLSRLSMIDLHKRAYRAQQLDHLEVCGVLVVGEDRMIDLRYVESRSTEPYHYEICIEDIVAIENGLCQNSEWILGTFHSHPVAEAVPGPGDLEHGFFAGIELIYDVCGREARSWKKETQNGQVDLVSLPIEVSTLE